MKLLIITPYIPFPLSEGGKISQFAIIDYLRKFYTITLVVIVRTHTELGYVTELKTLFPEVKVEAINLLPPRVNKSIIKQALKQLKNKIKNNIGRRSDYSASPEDAITDFDNNYFVNLVYSKNRKLIEAITTITTSERYDAVQIDLIDFIDLVYLFDENIKKIFVHHELRFGRLDSMIPAVKRNHYEHYIYQTIRETELNYLKKYDAIIVFSEQDKNKLEIDAELNGKVYVSQFPVLDNFFVPVYKTEAKIEKLLFIGGDSHFPNFDAVCWYVNEIETLVSSKTNLRLHVVGNWSETSIDKVDKHKKVHFEGFVDDLISFCTNSIILVPVRYGSGIRTKILYAMAQGLPIISTAIGSEGIKVEHGVEVMIANTPAEMAEYINVLVSDVDLRYRLSVKAQQTARALYSQAVAGELRKQLLQYIVYPK